VIFYSKILSCCQCHQTLFFGANASGSFSRLKKTTNVFFTPVNLTYQMVQNVLFLETYENNDSSSPVFFKIRQNFDKCEPPDYAIVD